MKRALLNVAVAAIALGSPAVAFAGDPNADGSYGRVEGDLLFIGEVGAALTLGGPELETHVGLVYLSTAGGYFRYTEAFENENAPFARMISAGFELRPLFLGRYALDLEKGPAHLDLFVDSFALVIGATWGSPERAKFDTMPGLELGLSIEVPFLSTASGPRLGVLGLARWANDDLTGKRDADFLERGSTIILTLAWHQVFDANLVDIRDR